MSFLLPDGRLVSPDVAFTLDEIQYPANFLRLSSEEEKAALGITWAEPDPVWDQRFYWGYDADGALITKDHAQLIDLWVGQTKQTAATLLAPFDWYITRQVETGKAVPQEVLDYRAAVRVISDDRETALRDTTDTDQLAAVVTGDFGGLLPWPLDPFAPGINEEEPAEKEVASPE